MPTDAIYFMQHKVFYCAKINKQSAKEVFRFNRVTIAHRENLLSAHAFNYIVLGVKPGLISCEDLAMISLFTAIYWHDRLWYQICYS